MITEVNKFYQKVVDDAAFANNFHQAVLSNNVFQIEALVRQAGITMGIATPIDVEVTPEGNEVGIEIFDGDFSHEIHISWMTVAQLVRNARIIRALNLQINRFLSRISSSLSYARSFDTAVGNNNLRSIRSILRARIINPVFVNRVRPTVRRIRFEVCSVRVAEACAEIDMRW